MLRLRLHLPVPKKNCNDDNDDCGLFQQQHLASLKNADFKTWFSFDLNLDSHSATTAAVRHDDDHHRIADLKRAIAEYFFTPQYDDRKVVLSMDGYALHGDQKVSQLLRDGDVVHVHLLKSRKRRKQKTTVVAVGRSETEEDEQQQQQQKEDRLLKDRGSMSGNGMVERGGNGAMKEATKRRKREARKRNKRRKKDSGEALDVSKKWQQEERNVTAVDDDNEIDDDDDVVVFTASNPAFVAAADDDDDDDDDDDRQLRTIDVESRNMLLNQLIRGSFSSYAMDHLERREEQQQQQNDELDDKIQNQKEQSIQPQSQSMIVEHEHSQPAEQITPVSVRKSYAHYLSYTEGTTPQTGDVIAFKKLDASSGLVSKYMEAKILRFNKENGNSIVQIHLMHPEDKFLEERWDELLNVKYIRWEMDITDEERKHIDMWQPQQAKQVPSSKPSPSTKVPSEPTTPVRTTATYVTATPDPTSVVSAPVTPASIPTAFGSSRRTPTPSSRPSGMYASSLSTLSSPLGTPLPEVQLFEDMHVNFVTDSQNPIQQTGIVHSVDNQECMAQVSGERVPFSNITTPVPPQCSVGELVRVCRGKYAGKVGAIEGFQPLQHVWLVRLDQASAPCIGFKREYLARHAPKQRQQQQEEMDVDA